MTKDLVINDQKNITFRYSYTDKRITVLTIFIGATLRLHHCTKTVQKALHIT